MPTTSQTILKDKNRLSSLIIKNEPLKIFSVIALSWHIYTATIKRAFFIAFIQGFCCFTKVLTTSFHATDHPYDSYNDVFLYKKILPTLQTILLAFFSIIIIKTIHDLIKNQYATTIKELTIIALKKTIPLLFAQMFYLAFLISPILLIIFGIIYGAQKLHLFSNLIHFILFDSYLIYIIVTLLGILIVYLSVKFILFQFPLIIDNQKIISSFSKSFDLVKGSWWHTATIYSIPITIVFFSHLSFSIVAVLSVFTPLQSLCLHLVLWFLHAAIIPFSYSMELALYYNLNIKKYKKPFDNY